jgi:protein translocase SecG subunit
MKNILMISQAVISTLMALIILVQGKDEGLSASFQSNQSFQSTRRGADRVIFTVTVVLATLFILNAVAFILVK